MSILANRVIEADQSFAELYRQPIGGPAGLTVLLTNLLETTGLVNPVEILLVEAASVVMRSFTINARGANYQTVPGVRLTTKAATPPVLAARMELATVQIRSPGIYYRANDLLTLPTGAGAFATVRVNQVDGNGRITRLSIVSRGNYTALDPDQVNVQPTGGAGRHATVALTYQVLRVDVVSEGQGYSEIPLAEIDGSAQVAPVTSYLTHPRHRLVLNDMVAHEITTIKDLSIDAGDVILVRATAANLAARVMS